MDFKKVSAATNTQTRDLTQFEKEAGNVYAAINIIAKRSDQISVEIKDELNRKLEEFATQQDNLEEIFENREQIEISRFYERLPKPSAIAIKEFEDSKIYFRKPEEEI
jgi:DNA-directed RNA polymerase subunit K/omega